MGRLLPGINDLQTLYPEIAAQASGWDPSEIAAGSHKKLQWSCAKGHQWNAVVKSRIPPMSCGCPYCQGSLCISGVNDLATLHPEIAAQANGWDPSLVKPKSNKKLSWKCQEGHLWKASVQNRTPPLSKGCPICKNKKVLQGVNDLATLYPKVAKQADGWDPNIVIAGSHSKLPWVCQKGHKWKACVKDRIPPGNTGCPYCSGKRVDVGENDLFSLYPKLASEADGWDPKSVSPGSGKKLPWRCEKGHQWFAVVQSRTPPRSHGCPVCSGQRVLTGFNDLASIYPDIAEQADGWDPSIVSSGSKKKYLWMCKHGHSWSASVASRTPPINSGCPFCSGRLAITGVNDLETLYPEVAKQADGWDPSLVLPKSNKKMTWKCARGHIWKASPNSRTPPASCGCPICSNRQLLQGDNDLLTLFPGIAAEADGWDPAHTLTGSSLKLSWKCREGHTWIAMVRERCYGKTGCPTCANYGFKPGLPAWLYLVERPGEQQIGITNEPDIRLAKHSYLGWQQVDLLGPHPGQEILNIERDIKRWLNKVIGLIPGKTENWFTSTLEVESLAELISKSGIQTNLLP